MWLRQKGPGWSRAVAEQGRTERSHQGGGGSQEEGAAPREEGCTVSWEPLEASEKPLLSLAGATRGKLLGTVEGTREAGKWRWTRCLGGGGQALEGSRSKA